MFDASNQPFHPKVYIFRMVGRSGVAFIGSSNLSNAALVEGVEWSYRVVPSRDRAGFTAVEEAFERLFRHPKTLALTHGWIDGYAERRRPPDTFRPSDTTIEPPPKPPEPHDVQREALAALAETREAGNRAGLVVLATGLGKTWLAAFDTASSTTRAEPFRRVLFVAHREEILSQALRDLPPHPTQGAPRTLHRSGADSRRRGLSSRQSRRSAANAISSSSRPTHSTTSWSTSFITPPRSRIAASSIISNLASCSASPRRPERTDGGDLLALCGENLVYRCDLLDGIRRGLLSPFHYFGVPDEVDYENIPWKSARFDPTALEHALATEARARNAVEQWHKHAGSGSRTLAFCCSTRHADFMASFFRREGLRVASVHSQPSSDPRAASLDGLRDGALDVVFAVDMLNEGVDVPSIDTVLMLRPTESRIMWLQQLGRGLRRAEGKAHLTVVDYIGNHRTFLSRPRALLTRRQRGQAQSLERLEAGKLELPPGCEVTYDLER